MVAPESSGCGIWVLMPNSGPRDVSSACNFTHPMVPRGLVASTDAQSINLASSAESLSGINSPYALAVMASVTMS